MNNTIFFFFYNLAHQSDILDKVIIFFAVYFPYVVVILAGLFLLFHHEVFRAENPFQDFLQKKKEILSVFVAGVVAWVLAYVLKILFAVPRPFVTFSKVQALIPENGFAFPSGHATFFMSLAFSIFLLHKKAGYVFLSFALLIGIARIVAGVHFPIDVLSGFVLGSVIAYLFKKI